MIIQRIKFEQTLRKPGKPNVADFRECLQTELHIDKGQSVSFLRHLDASNDLISLQPVTLPPPSKVTFDRFWVLLAALGAILIMISMTG